jgi:hypothetical protein
MFVDDALVAKMDRGLAELVRRGDVRPDTRVPVMVTLTGTPSASPTDDPSAGPAARMERDFKRETSALMEALHRAGATQIQPLWISRSIAMEIPIAGLLEVAADPTIKRATLLTQHQIALPTQDETHGGAHG